VNDAHDRLTRRGFVKVAGQGAFVVGAGGAFLAACSSDSDDASDGERPASKASGVVGRPCAAEL